MRRNVSGKVVQILMLPLLLASSIAFPQTNQIDAVKSTGVEILSGLPPDQMAVFTGKVLPAIISQTKKAWYPIIPREAQPPQLEKGEVAIEFELYSDGKIRKMVLSSPSGKIALDRAAWGALTGAQPFAPFPPELTTEMIRLRFLFSYDLKPGDTANLPSGEAKSTDPVN
jgi:TonB family protein